MNNNYEKDKSFFIIFLGIITKQLETRLFKILVLPALMGYLMYTILHQFDLRFQLEQSLNLEQHFSK